MTTKSIKAIITKHTRIELGLLVSIMAVVGSGLVFVVRSLASVEDHTNRISRIESREARFEVAIDDINYLRGRFDATFPPKKNRLDK
jgi:hypothetical protein